MGLRIQDIKVYKMNVSPEIWIFLKIETDEGLCGWGEITGSGNDDLTASFIDMLAATLRGKDPRDIKNCMHGFYQWKYPKDDRSRTYATAWSGINQCLWDILAKSLGVPLYMLYGASKKEIPLYANLNRALRMENRRMPDEYKQNAQKALNEGFRILKCTPFDEVIPGSSGIEMWESGMKRFEAVLETNDIQHTIIDCHQRFTSANIGNVVDRIIGSYGSPYWIEDPCDPFLEINKTIIQYISTRACCAGGEALLTLADMNMLIEKKLFQTLIPDVKHIGGVDAIRTLIPNVESMGLSITIHNPHGPIATAHSAHLMALSNQETPLEFPCFVVKDRAKMVEPMEPIHNGFYLLGDLPGIGIEPSQAALTEFANFWSNGEWRK